MGFVEKKIVENRTSESSKPCERVKQEQREGFSEKFVAAVM